MTVSNHWQYSDEILTNSLRGLVRTNPDLKYLAAERVVYSSSSSKDKVAILSGGGAGHEPLHAGFVGKGMLDVAVSGQVFASPSVKQIYSGLKATKSNKGTLVVVKNYTGDVIHFGMATQKVQAEGYNAKLLVVQDDVAVPRSKNAMVGRRALAGTCLVHKVIGAKAAQDGAKATLDEVYDIGQRVNRNLATVGASLDHVVIPKITTEENSTNEDEDGSDSDEEVEGLKPDEAEIGMGIHNEPGIKRISPIPDINDLLDEMLGYIFSKEDKRKDIMLISTMAMNLGATSNLELFAIQNYAVQLLRKKYGIDPVRCYTGTFTTSLDGPGFSITILNITKAGGKEIKECLDYPTDVPAWNCHVSSATWENALGDQAVVEEPEEIAHPKLPTSNVKFDSKLFREMLTEGSKRALEKEPKITLYDTVAGDGDCGETLSRGANGILKAFRKNSLEETDAVKSLSQLTDLIETKMGGTSGGLYAIFISGLANSFKRQEEQNGKGFNVGINATVTALKDALATLENYTRARKGDRTMMDALIPFIEKLDTTKDVKKAALAAHEGAEATRKMNAMFGRAAYVGKEEFKQFEAEGGLPDPGAIGLAAILSGFADAYSKN
ncbi:hypothetical protein HII13_004555 [Brettanomyces bruxellensis]|nr:hypothetical protein HII13_004555 [Brettanomyces bruxellensis]